LWLLSRSADIAHSAVSPQSGFGLVDYRFDVLLSGVNHIFDLVFACSTFLFTSPLRRSAAVTGQGPWPGAR